MADDTRNAEVVLNANVDGYTQGTQTAYADTNKLIGSVNKLAASMDGLTKRMGKKLVIFGAADLATMTAMVSVTAKYEKQLATLTAQTTIGHRQIEIYKKGIDTLARSVPATRGELAALVTQINSLGITSEKQAVAMARTFTNLAAATGENVGALTQGMIELSRQMGTLGTGATGMNNFADTLTSITNTAGVSAQAVLNFSQSIAPMARAAGIGQKEVMGIATAFTKAGADGFAAANAFSTIVSDITRQTMNGSPEIAKYASVIGATVEQFKELDPAERLVQIFEAVNKAGPNSVRVLDRLGIDGIRAAKAIQAVSAEQGGLRKAIEEAGLAYGQGSTQTGANAAFNTLDAKTTQLRKNMELIASAIGEGVMPWAKAFLDVTNKILEVTNQIAKPFLFLGGFLGTLLGGVSTMVGSLMTMMGPLSQLMLALTLFRLSPIRGAIEGFRVARGAPMGAAAQAMSTGPWYQRIPYMLGGRAGNALPENAGRVGGNAVARVSRALLTSNPLGLSVSQVANYQSMLYQNAGMADYWNRNSPMGRGLGEAGTWTRERGVRLSDIARGAVQDPRGFFGATFTKLRNIAPPIEEDLNEKPKQSKPGWRIGPKELSDEQSKLATETKALTTEVGKEVSAKREVGRAAMGAAKSLAQVQLAAAGMGLRAAGQAGYTGAKGMLSGIAGMAGLSSPQAGAAILAVAATAYTLRQKNDETYKSVITADTGLNVSRTNAALGLATESLKEFSTSVSDGTRAVNDLKDVNDAMTLNRAERSQAMQREVVDQRIKGLTTPTAAVSFLQSMGEMSPEAARSLMQDVYKQFGPVMGQQIQKQFAAADMDRYTMDMSAITGPLYKSARQNTNAGFVGGLRNIDLIGNLIPGDTNTSEQVQAAWVAAMQNTADVTGKYGTEPGLRKEFANIQQLLNEGLKDYKTPGGVAVAEQTIKQFESQFGQLGLFTDTGGIHPGAGGGQISSARDLFKYMFEKDNMTEGAVAFRAQAKEAGLTEKDLMSMSDMQAQEAAVRLQRGSMSDFELNVRSTALGRFARTNEDVLAVTEGSQIGNEKAIGTAIQEMYDKLTSNGNSFDKVTTSANKLAEAAGSATDPLYQLAMAAKGLAQSRAVTEAGHQGGWVGSLRERMRQNTEELLTAPKGESRNNFKLQRDQINEEGYQAAVAYESAMYQYQKSTIRAQEDYHQQLIWGERDFARNMTRAIEDTAKSIYNPMQRIFNPGTLNVQTLIGNLEHQNELIKEQVKNIAKAKKAGVSQEAIDTLQWTDPSQAFELDRIMSEGLTKNTVRRINAAVGTRVGGTGDLMSEQQGTRRAEEDYFRGIQRQATLFGKSMKRAAEDMHDYGRVAKGGLDDVTRAIKRLAHNTNQENAPQLDKIISLAEFLYKPEPSGVYVGPSTQSTENQNQNQTANRPTFTGPSATTTSSQSPYPDSFPHYPQPRAVRPTRMAAGGLVTGSIYAELGELAKPEVVIPLNQAGSRYLGHLYADITREMVKGLSTHGKGSKVAYKGAGSTTINNSTDIHVRSMVVQAKNPKELMDGIERETRVKNMRKGANAPI